MPRLFFYRAFMPTLCHYLNCRNRANTLSPNLFCTEHFHKTPVAPCKHLGTPLFRGFCRSCFIAAFPDDPLTFQMLYRSKTDALQKFLFSRFDGFIEKSPGLYCFTINKVSIFVSTCVQIKPEPNSVVIICHFDKIVTPQGSIINPMLWKRLVALENIVNQEIENAVLNVDYKGEHTIIVDKAFF